MAGGIFFVIKKPAPPPPYDPPEGDELNYNFSSGYVAPDNEDADFTFPE